jgi:hypothetical protein
MSEHYVSNEQLFQAIVAYRKSVRRAKRNNEDKPVLPDYIGECILKIADRLSRKPNFYSYTFRDEMISDAVENCIMYVDNFDPNKSKNPFSYFTQIIYYAFLRRIHREKKHLYVKYKIAEQLIHNHDRSQFEDDNLPSSPNSSRGELYDNIAEYIDSFEKKLDIKKSKKRGLELFMEEE